MNCWPLSSYEMLHTILGLCLGEVWFGNLGEFCQELVALISGKSYCMEVRSGCGGYRKQGRVEGCCIHHPFSFYVDQQGAGFLKISSKQGASHLSHNKIPLVCVKFQMKGEFVGSISMDGATICS